MRASKISFIEGFFAIITKVIGVFVHILVGDAAPVK